MKMKQFFALCLVAVAFATTPAFSADYVRGLIAYGDGDYATALREWQPLAEQGDAEAQFQMGWLYKNGYGVPQNDKQVVEWWELSAEQGYARAQYNLGLMYRKGQGVPQDYKEAVKWYRLSAEQGDTYAQYNLGFMYNNGYGVLQDYVRAHMWYNIVVSNGYETATEYRDGLAEKMTSAEIDKAQDLARACVAKDYKGC